MMDAALMFAYRKKEAIMINILFSTGVNCLAEKGEL